MITAVAAKTASETQLRESAIVSVWTGGTKNQLKASADTSPVARPGPSP